MEVTFSVLLGGALLGEEEVMGRIDELRLQLQALDETEGLLTLYYSTGSFKLTSFRDALTPLIGAFCFDAVADLASGKNVAIPITAYDETASLKVKGDVIVVSSLDGEEDWRPARPLLEALAGCGERFVALLKVLHAEEPDWKERLAGWDQLAAATRAHLR